MIMNNKKTPDLVYYNIHSFQNNANQYIGVQACQSCRQINYNGQTCGSMVSPFAGQIMSPDQWCRYWTPRLHNPTFNN